jgi:hypothetical protein
MATVDLGRLGGMGGLFGDGTGGSSEFGSGLGAAPATPQFFGAKIEGQRIVFVLDNSGSMQGGRLETVNAELERCVASLDPDQEFYVIFYSDVPYPLFYPDPVDRTCGRRRGIRAAPIGSTRSSCAWGRGADALSAAASIGRMRCYCSRMGEFGRKMAALLPAAGIFRCTRRLGLGGAAAASQQNLADIAVANGGDFARLRFHLR